MEPSKGPIHKPHQRYLEPSESVDGDAEYHQHLVQHPGNSPHPMPAHTNYNEQRSDPEVTNYSIIENGADISQYSTGEFFDRYENGCNPPANDNNPHKTPSPTETTDPLSPYQQPLFRSSELPSSSNSPLHVQTPSSCTSNILQEIQPAPVKHFSEVSCQIQLGIASPRGPISSGAVEESVTYWCPECDFSTTFQIGLTVHQTKAHSGRNLPCTQCGSKFLSQRALDKHSKIHDTRNKRFKYKKCAKKFSLEKYLRKHVYCSHSENLPYECDVCPKRFIYEYYLVNHKRSHEGHEKKVQKKTKKENERSK